MNLMLYSLLIQVTFLKVLCVKVPFPLEHSKWLTPSPSHLQRDGLFGYSAAYQPNLKKFIISAPKWDSTGTLFSCDTGSFGSYQCVQIRKPLFAKQPKLNQGSYYWGANVKASANFYMSCAPRVYKNDDENIKGKCFYQNNESNDLKPMLEVETQVLSSDLRRQIDLNNIARWGSISRNYLQKLKEGKSQFPGEYAMTSFGWSVEITDDDTVLVGGPAGFSGRVALYHSIEDLPYLIQLDNKNFQKSNGSVLFNFGYSITSGNFFNNRYQYAISTTYGDVGEGKVLLFDEKGVYLHKTIVDSEQIGAMFGASLASAKLDGFSTFLLVGSPTFSAAEASSDLAQLGAVKIYKPVRDSLHLYKTIKGFESESYFGLNVARVSDLNQDNKDDIVISAPYENEGRGAIYIYSGAELVSSSSSPISTPVPYLQKVNGENVGGYFGLSISPINDFDENGCNELAIGEPGHNRVMLLHCIKSIDVKLQAEFPDLNVNSSLIKNNGEYNYFFFRPCLQVTLPKKPENISTEILVTTTMEHPNAIIIANKMFIASLVLSPPYCGMVKVQLPEGGNYDKPLQIKVETSIRNVSTNYDKNQVTLSDVSITSLSGSVWGIGSELRMDISTTIRNGYIIGSTDTESISVNVTNERNVAHAPCVRVNVLGASIAKASDTCKSSKETLTCSPTTALYTNSYFTNHIILDTKTIMSSSDKLTIKAELFNDCSTPRRHDGANVVKTIIVTLQKDIRGNVTGESIPSSVMNMAESDLQTGNQIITHAYKINNYGNTTWNKVKCQVTLPPYVTTKVSVDLEPCSVVAKVATCTINKLPKESTVKVFVTITIPPGSTLRKLSKGIIDTSLVLLLNKDQISQRVTTTVLLQETKVPVWTIALAVVLGIITLVIIYFILREAGFLRRKNKEKLEELKKEVRRQSIRRSMRDSMVAKKDFRKDLEDHLKLISSREDLNNEDPAIPENSERKRNSQSNVKTTRAKVH